MPLEETVPTSIEEPIPPDGNGDPAPAPAPIAPTGRRQAVDLSKAPPEAMPFIEAARAQEKQKLYRDLKDTAELRKQITDLTNQLTTLTRQVSTSTPVVTPKPATLDEQITSLRDMITDTRTLILQRDRESELRAYRAEKVAELRGANIGFVESLVSGNTREDIDLSLELAKAEYMQIEADIEARRPPQSTLGGARPVIVRQGNARPAGVPPVVTPGAANDAGPTVSEAEIKELTSFEAIRSGDFKKNRSRLMTAIKTGRVAR